MCGIAGIVARRNGFDLGRAIKEMTRQVEHRGPDDEGYAVHGRVALGHRRLAVIDLSPGGHQPMISADGRYVITFNGEIYNFPELRAELETLGHRFRSKTDTEVILAAFASWGKACLSRFNGMWAFAIHDIPGAMIFAARDRFGVKPFHYVSVDDCFAFGSEIRQLLPLLPSVGANPRAVSEFLLSGVQASATETFFEEIHSLAPGHYLTYDLRSERCAVERYYSLSDRLAGTDEPSGLDAVQDFKRIFEDAVRLRLQSDVRVGTCLSGGVDSSSIALVASGMQRSSGGIPFGAVTAISESPRNSEESYAERVVAAGELDWIKVRPGYDDFCRMLPGVVSSQEEPFASASICMQAFVMEAARQNGIVVLLDGQGGDETMLGYERYYAAYLIDLWRTGGGRALFQGVRDATHSNFNMNVARLAAFLLYMTVPTVRHLHQSRRASYLKEVHALPAWVENFSSAFRDVRRLQILEIESITLPALLRYEDRNSMAFSIETRLPFLDYRLVEKAISLSPRLKMRDGWTKWALRQSMSDVLPREIAWRRDKIGFAAPDDIWLTRHAEAMERQVSRSLLIERFCDASALRRRFRAIDRNSQWRLYSLALWEEQFGVRA